MKNLGNVSGMIRASSPPQWTEVYVCHDCKIKKEIIVSGSLCDETFDFGDWA
ncbi:MAG: hypothetical protein PF549_02785 [Patescibacteria group bacterium]|nr:hypothetical protein [Patescibacteria group bacterium]